MSAVEEIQSHEAPLGCALCLDVLAHLLDEDTLFKPDENQAETRNLTSRRATELKNIKWTWASGKDKELRFMFLDGEDVEKEFARKYILGQNWVIPSKQFPDGLPKPERYDDVWGKYIPAPIRFMEYTKPFAQWKSDPPEIRITFSTKQWFASIGQSPSKNDYNLEMDIQGTLNTKTWKVNPWTPREIEDFIRKNVLHEMGHILGLVHEHQIPGRDSKIPWSVKSLKQFRDRVKTIKEARIKINPAFANRDYWKMYTEAQVVKDDGGLDPKSVMMYDLPAEVLDSTKANFADLIAPHNTLSNGDVKTIRRMYVAA